MVCKPMLSGPQDCTALLPFQWKVAYGGSLWAYSLSGLAIPWKTLSVKSGVLATNSLGVALPITDHITRQQSMVSAVA